MPSLKEHGIIDISGLREEREKRPPLTLIFYFIDLQQMTVTTLTATEKQSKLEILAVIDSDILASTTVKELREMVKGVVVNYSKLNKPELLDHISDRTAPIREANRIALEVAALEVAKTKERNMELEAAKLSPAKSAGWRAVYGNANHSEIMENVKTNLELIALDSVNHLNHPLDFSTKLGAEVSKYLLLLARCYADSTQKSSVTEMNNFLNAWVESLQDDAFAENKKNAVSIFKYQVGKSMKSLCVNLYIENEAKVLAKIQYISDLKPVAAIPLLERAVTVLEKLTDYRDVAIALAIVTGRRMGEIMATLKVYDIGDNLYVNVSGLTKAKSDKETALAKIHNIPVLASPALIIRALQYLEDGGFRMEIADDVNPKYGKTMARQLDKWQDVLGCKTTFKSLRALYAAICFERIGNAEGIKDLVYFAKVLVHSGSDLNTGHTYFVWNIVD